MAKIASSYTQMGVQPVIVRNSILKKRSTRGGNSTIRANDHEDELQLK